MFLASDFSSKSIRLQDVKGCIYILALALRDAKKDLHFELGGNGSCLMGQINQIMFRVLQSRYDTF